MNNGEFLRSQTPGAERVALGYVKPLGQPQRPVICSVVGDRLVFEGCIIVGTLAKKTGGQEGVAIVGEQFRWPDRAVPYVIDGNLPNPHRVTEAIAHWHEHTEMKFRERTDDDDDYVVFSPVDSGCASSVGRQGGAQSIVLGPGCSVGNVIHEIGHTVGLWHEQSRTDRDSMIEIVWGNIDPATRHNFEQHIVDGEDLGAYDLGSIMHYPLTAFSMNGNVTLRPLKPLPPGVVIGQRKGLSAGDIAAVAKLYP